MHEEFPFTACFFIALILKYRIEAYLFNRQMKHLKEGRNMIPPFFADKITLEEHQKASDYNLTHLNAKRAFSIIDLILLLIWTVGGGLNQLQALINYFNLGPLSSGILFISIFSIISAALKLPEDIYMTFVVEEKYGFNKTTFNVFLFDLFKSFCLSVIIGIPLILGILYFMQEAGNLWWLWAFFLTAGIQILTFWIYPILIAPLFNKFFTLEEGELKTRLNLLLKKVRFANQGLYVMDASKRSSHGNAYFTGFGPNKRVILYDTLLQKLNHEEIESILAHELGHFNNKHMIKNLILFLITGFILFALMGKLYQVELFYLGHGVNTYSNHITFALFLLIIPIYTFPLTPFFSKISRKMEFEADDYAKKLAGSGATLRSALIKTYKDNSAPVSTDEKYSSFYYSHPPLYERLKALED